MATAAIYCRVSTEEQAEHGYSLRDQEAACRAYAARLGCSEPIIVIRDEGVTGAVIERPGIQRLIALAASVDYVICKDPDRLARNLGHQLLLTERIERQGAQLRFVDFERQHSPEGQLFYALRGAIAEYDRAKITQRLMAGKIRKAQEGGIPTRIFAYGYRQHGALEIDPAEAEVVRQIYHWYLHGLDDHPPPVPPRVIADHLNRLGVPTKIPGCRWEMGTIYRMLRSPTYAGRLYFRREDASGEVGNRFRPVEERARRRERPRSEWIEIPVPAIVSEEIWHEAQRMHRLASALRPQPRYRQYLLTGLAVCGLCGHNVVGTSRKGQGNEPPRVSYYACQQRSQRQACKLPYVRAEPVEEQVWQTVREWIESPETLREVVERRQQREENEDRGAVEEALRSLREEQRRLLRLYQKGIGPEEEIEHSLEELRNQESVLTARLAEAVSTRVPNLPSIEAVAAELRPRLDDSSVDARRTVLRKIVEQVVFLGKSPKGIPRLRIVPRV